jgi:uncharacterized protein (DUF1330 family)
LTSIRCTDKEIHIVAKGYVIITEDIKDPAGMAEYGKLAMKAMDGATVLSVDQKPQVLEGAWHGSQTVVLEFESVEAARAWYYSDAYQAAAKIRQGAAECNGGHRLGVLSGGRRRVAADVHDALRHAHPG